MHQEEMHPFLYDLYRLSVPGQLVAHVYRVTGLTFISGKPGEARVDLQPLSHGDEATAEFDVPMAFFSHPCLERITP